MNSEDVPKGPDWMHLCTAAHADNIGLVRVAVASFASSRGFTLDEVEEIKIAVSEAASNAVLHAYGGNAEKPWVDVSACFDDGTLTVKVRDEGVGIEDVRRAMQASFSTRRDRMGLGFTFMNSFMDEVSVESDVSRGTTIILKKSPGNWAEESQEEE